MGQDGSYVGFSQDPGCNEPFLNYSLNFSGDADYVELQQVTNIGSASNTVSMWVKIPVVGQDNLNEGERVGNLLGNYNSSPNSNWEVTQGKIRIWWNNGEKDINGSLDLRDNQWHHLAFVRDKENNQFLANTLTSLMSFVLSKDGIKYGLVPVAGPISTVGSSPAFGQAFTKAFKSSTSTLSLIHI